LRNINIRKEDRRVLEKILFIENKTFIGGIPQ